MDRTPRDQFIHDLFVTAVEGGINYWSQTTDYHWHLPLAEGEKALDKLDLRGFYAVIEETPEDDTRTKHRINRAVIVRGLKLLASGEATYGGKPISPRMQARFAGIDRTNGDGEDYDASDADNVVQVGLFGDVVYG
jgi:hypothetical protein